MLFSCPGFSIQACLWLVDVSIWRQKMVAADQAHAPITVTVPCWPSSRDAPRATERHPVLRSEWWAATFIFCTTPTARAFDGEFIGTWHVRQRGSWGAAEPDRGRLLSSHADCEKRKSHSCELLHLQVSLAEKRLQPRRGPPPISSLPWQAL